MAWAVFHKTFDHDLRPAKGVCIHVSASPDPQNHPEALIAAAEAANCCIRTADPRDGEMPATARRKAK
jgi:hypothetical protein